MFAISEEEDEEEAFPLLFASPRGGIVVDFIKGRPVRVRSRRVRAFGVVRVRGAGVRGV